MRVKKGAWDGAQPRTHVLSVLRKHGVIVEAPDDGGDYYTLVDNEGDPSVMHIPNPVPSEMVGAIYRRFGHHGFAITDLRAPKKHH